MNNEIKRSKIIKFLLLNYHSLVVVVSNNLVQKMIANEFLSTDNIDRADILKQIKMTLIIVIDERSIWIVLHLPQIIYHFNI